MKRLISILVFVVGGTPAFAQGIDEQEGRDLNLGGRFAQGNLAVQDLFRPADPVQQLKIFFADVKLPLTKDQEQRLNAIVKAQQNDTRLATDRAASNDEIRAVNQEYFKQINVVLTPEQQGSWRHYRAEQIRLRGGFPALKQVLEQGGVPLADAQEKSIQKIFENFAARHARLAESTTNPEVVEVDRLVVAEFDRVIALLTAEQRTFLQRARRREAVAINRR